MTLSCAHPGCPNRHNGGGRYRKYCSKRCYHRHYGELHRERRNARLRERYATDADFRTSVTARNDRYASTERGQASLRARKERFYAKNPNYHLQYSAEHSVEGVARAQAWTKANPERRRELSRLAARSRRKGITSTPEARALIREWHQVIASDPCAYCGGPMTDLDHIEPVSKGGLHAWDNITSACKSCNSKKSTRSLLTFLCIR